MAGMAWRGLWAALSVDGDGLCADYGLHMAWLWAGFGVDIVRCLSDDWGGIRRGLCDG